MGHTVWLCADTLAYPEGGGHFWVYLNWALGLRECGCEVVWLEGADPTAPADRLAAQVAALRQRLAHYGFGETFAICSRTADPLPAGVAAGGRDVTEARDADLLLTLAYDSCAAVLPLFRRTALVDIDPGLLQVWMSEGLVRLPPHDLYFTIGETVGEPTALFPGGGVEWHYTPPCVATRWWPVTPAPPGAPFTTVSHWATSSEWVTFGEESYHNDKRSGFLPFIELPKHTAQPLELALCLAADETLRLRDHEREEYGFLTGQGWRVRHAHSVASTPWGYQEYVQRSRGEFSCTKPSCVRLQNAWVSDRTLCYLASGKPAVVQHTGPSRILPDNAGMFRFHDLAEAARCLEEAAADYARHCRLARELAEEHFDAGKVVRRVLERAIG